MDRTVITSMSLNPKGGFFCPNLHWAEESKKETNHAMNILRISRDCDARETPILGREEVIGLNWEARKYCIHIATSAVALLIKINVP